MTKMQIIDEIHKLAHAAYDERVNAVVEGNEKLASWLQNAHDQLVLTAHNLTVDASTPWEDVFDDIEEDEEESPSERRASIVRGLMMERSLSAEDVAEATGLGPRTVRNITNAYTDRPHERTLRTLEGFFNLTDGTLDG